MTDDQEQTKPSLSAGVWVLPALIVLGNLSYVAWLNAARRGLSGLGPLLLFMFVVVPGSLLFLAAYALTIARLRSSPRPRGTLFVVGLASLAGLVACALTFGALLGAFWLEAKLGG